MLKVGESLVGTVQPVLHHLQPEYHDIHEDPVLKVGESLIGTVQSILYHLQLE